MWVQLHCHLSRQRALEWLSQEAATGMLPRAEEELTHTECRARMSHTELTASTSLSQTI